MKSGRPKRVALSLGLLAVLAGCGGPETPSGGDATPGPPPGAPPEDSHPFYVESLGYLESGDWDSAEVVFENNRLMERADRPTLLAGSAMAFLQGRSNRAARDLARLHREFGADCMSLVFLGAARRRVDVAAGSRLAWKEVLERADCPAPAYAVAAERFARNESLAAEGRLPGEPFPATGPRAALLARLHGPGEGPGFGRLAAAAGDRLGGGLHATGDRFQADGDGITVVGHWVSRDLLLLAAYGRAGGPFPDAAALARQLEELLRAWREREPERRPPPAWSVTRYAAYLDVRGRFEAEVPEGWFASLFTGAGPALYIFAPVEVDDPEAEPLRAGEVPSFSLVVSERTGAAVPFTSEEVSEAVAEASSFFYGVDHATEPLVEVGTEAVPFLRLKRSFVAGEEVYRVAAAVVRPPGWTFKAAFAAPAERFDMVEQAFWRLVDTLRPAPVADGAAGGPEGP